MCYNIIIKTKTNTLEEENKMTNKVFMKEWFEDKLYKEWNLKFIGTMEVFCKLKETEKAIYAMVYVGYAGNGTYARHKCTWIPKSALYDGVDALQTISDYDEACKAFEIEYMM
jgi:hypothetical protein